MFNIVASVAGGIGLFLLGMILMTDGLKVLAGDALRGILSRYTTNRFSACAAGAGIPALGQSSSATPVATIGFVSAGLLPFTNAVGVIIGANLGTTSTGWLVSLLGIKLSIGKLLLPLIGIGAFARLVFRGRLAQIGSTLAGFAVIFVGIDVLQAGMAGVAGHVSPTDWPQATFGGRLLLVLIGMLMTIVMQSSSAAIATTLAALAGGAIDVPQAAALVIGQNIGTTVTAGVASIGGSVPAKRTAVAHVGFNVVTGVLAFLILPSFTWAVEQVAENGLGGDHALTIAAFHTAFNLLGVAIFLPLAPQYAHFIERRIKLKGPRLTQHLDPSLLQVPPVAIEAVRNVLKETAATLFDTLHERLRGDEGWFGGGELTEIDTALGESRRFLAKVSPPTTVGFEFSRQISTLHALDHLQRLANDMHEPESLRFARSHEALRPVCSELTAILQDLAAQLRDPATEPDAARVETFSRQLADERRTARPQILQATAARQIDAEAGLRQLRAQRWLDRIAYHIWRASHHLREMTRKEAAVAEAAGDGADSGQSPGATQE